MHNFDSWYCDEISALMKHKPIEIIIASPIVTIVANILSPLFFIEHIKYTSFEK